MSEFLTFDHTDHRRWWVLRKGDRAVSLTAILIPAGTPTLTGEYQTADGVRLLAECFTLHAPGTEAPDCPALVGGCDEEGEAISGAPDLLSAWLACDEEDRVISDGLAEVLAREVTR